MNIYNRNSDYRSWWYYKVKWTCWRTLTEGGERVQKHGPDTFWTPYHEHINSDVEHKAELTGWDFISYEWEVVDERKGIPSREEHPHMIMEV